MSKINKHAINNHKSILSQPQSYFLQTNDIGDTTLHILAKYNHVTTIKKIITKYPTLINTTNISNETISHILFNNTEFITWTLQQPNTNINIIDDTNNTILTKNIQESQTKNDPSFVIIKLLLKHKADLTIPQTNPPLILCATTNKLHITKLLIDNGANPNITNTNYINPLITSITHNNNDITNYLLTLPNIDINYSGPLNTNNPLIIAISNNNIDITNTLINKSVDLNKTNMNNETPLHIAIKYGLSPTIIFTLLSKTDINIAATNGYTPIHLLIQNGTWKDYSEILKNKNINLFTTPLNSFPIENITSFIDKILIPKYILKNKCKKLNKQKCKNIIKKYFLKHKSQTLPKTIKQKITFIQNTKEQPFGTFNADVMHSMIYTMYLLKKYKNLIIPYQYFSKDKQLNDQLLCDSNCVYKHNESIQGIIGSYITYFYEISPYLILWKNKYEYYIHPDLDFHINNCFASKYRYIYFKITFIISDNNGHANIILYDKQKNTLERFDSYGHVPFQESNDLDVFLKSYFSELLPKFTYYTPKDIFGDSLGFQALSKDDKIYVKKTGDPTGYCLAWTIWYIEQRMQNPNIHPRDIVKKVKNNIMTNNKENKKNIFIDFIRNYSQVLTNEKIDVYKKAGINKEYNYDLVLKPGDQDKLQKYLSQTLLNII